MLSAVVSIAGHLFGFPEDKAFGSSLSSSDELQLPATDGAVGKEDGNTRVSTLTESIGSPVFN